MVDAQDWTILRIGGPMAAGKTTLAESLASRLGARCIDVDLFWIVLRRALSHQVAPELHLLDGDDIWREDPQRLVQHYLRASEHVCRAIEPVIAHHHIIGRRVILEGCWLLPEFAVKGEFAGTPVPDRLRAVFLDEPDIAAIEARIRSRPHHWLERLPDESRRNHLEMQRLYNKHIRDRAEALGLLMVSSTPFETLESRVLEGIAK